MLKFFVDHYAHQQKIKMPGTKITRNAVVASQNLLFLFYIKCHWGIFHA